MNMVYYITLVSSFLKLKAHSVKDLFWLLARSRLILQFNIGIKLLFSVYVVVLLVVSLLVT